MIHMKGQLQNQREVFVSHNCVTFSVIFLFVFWDTFFMANELVYEKSVVVLTTITSGYHWVLAVRINETLG